MGLPSSLRAADPAPDHERLGNCGKLNEDLPPAGQPPSGALARNKHQILVHTLRTIFHRCMRRGLVTKKVCPGFQVWEMPKRAFNNGTLTIKTIPNQNQNQKSNDHKPLQPKIKFIVSLIMKCTSASLSFVLVSMARSVRMGIDRNRVAGASDLLEQGEPG